MLSHTLPLMTLHFKIFMHRPLILKLIMIFYDEFISHISMREVLNTFSAPAAIPSNSVNLMPFTTTIVLIHTYSPKRDILHFLFIYLPLFFPFDYDKTAVESRDFLYAVVGQPFIMSADSSILIDRADCRYALF